MHRERQRLQAEPRGRTPQTLNNMKKEIIGSMGLLMYVNLVPYMCRLWRGLDWVAQYLPDKGHPIFGLLFFGAFASLPATPLIATYLRRRRNPVTFVISVIIATVLLSYWHHNYDLASDAQAAIGLVFIPIYAAVITGVGAAILGGIESFIRKRIANQAPEVTARKLADPQR